MSVMPSFAQTSASWWERKALPLSTKRRRRAAAEHGLLQHRQEGGGALGEGEGGVGDHPRRVVDERDEVRLALLAGDGDGRAVHDVAHPQVARLLEGEAPVVLGRRLARLLRHEPGAGEQPVYRARREWQALGDLPGGDRLADDELDRELALLVLDRDEEVRDLPRQGVRLTVVGAHPGLKRAEAALAVGPEPEADRLGRDPRAERPGDPVVDVGLLPEPRVEPLRAGRKVHEVPDHPVVEQGDLFRALLHVVIHGKSPLVGPWIGATDGTTACRPAGPAPLPVGGRRAKASAAEAGGRNRAAAVARRGAAPPAREGTRGPPRRPAPSGRR